MQSPSRRLFLQSALGAAALGGVGALGGWPAAAAARARAPSEIARVAVIGVGARGKYLIGNLPETARVVALCDCATSRVASALAPRGAFAPVLARFRERDASRCATYHDYRRLLDGEKLDAVMIAAPDHHHAPAALRALAAGLHVYCEKPLALTIREGRLLADAAARSGRVLQVGSQQRSMEVNRFACAFVRDGGLGRVHKVELPNYPGPLAAPDWPAEPTPADLDWELFLGSAPKRVHNRKLWVKEEFQVNGLLWRGWDLYRDYSGHLMTNWGAHSVDMVQCALGRDDTGPVEVMARPSETWEADAALWKSKTPPPIDARERRFWPVTMRYADGVELRFGHGPDFVVFLGEKGRLRMRRNHYETDPPGLAGPGPDAAEAAKWQGAGHVARPHLEDWLANARTGAAPRAPAEVGHRAATICHLANIARERNRPLRWNPTREEFENDAEANALLARPAREGF